MTTYNWSALADGANLASFSAATDELFFDDGSISAAEVVVSGFGGAQVTLAFGGKAVTLGVSPYALTTANVTFADGSLLVVGDNAIGTTNDGAASTVTGGSGDDLLIGAGGADTVSGGAGDDVLAVLYSDSISGYGNDTLDGGPGMDRVVYLNDGGVGLSVTLGTGYDTTPGANYGQFTGGLGGGGDGNPGSTLRLLGIEAVSGTPHDDTFTANSSSLVTGGPDDIWQRFEGRGGDDTLAGATGDGRVTLAEYAGAPGGVVVNLDTGGGLGSALDGHGGTDILFQIDGVVGSAFGDTLTGGGASLDYFGNPFEYFEGRGGNDFVSGGDGGDFMDGGAGNDTLDGGDGVDTLIGGLGADVLAGGAGDDAYRLAPTAALEAGRIVFLQEDGVVESPGASADTVHSPFSHALADGVENLVLTGAPMWRPYEGRGNGLDNFLATEGAARQRLYGEAGNDTLDGGDGNDTLDGGSGADVLLGGAGDDVLIWDAADTLVDGGAGTDTLRILGAGVALDLTAVPDTVIQDVEIIDLAGSGANSLTLALADVLAMSTTTDTLRIDGDAGDVVNGSGWTAGAISGGYQSWTQLAATLLVDTDTTTTLA